MNIYFTLSSSPCNIFTAVSFALPPERQFDYNFQSGFRCHSRYPTSSFFFSCHNWFLRFWMNPLLVFFFFLSSFSSLTTFLFPAFGAFAFCILWIVFFFFSFSSGRRIPLFFHKFYLAVLVDILLRDSIAMEENWNGLKFSVAEK